MNENIIQSIEKTHFEQSVQRFMEIEMAGEFEDAQGNIPYTISPDNTNVTMTATHGFSMSDGTQVHRGETVTFDASFNIVP